MSDNWTWPVVITIIIASLSLLGALFAIYNNHIQNKKINKTWNASVAIEKKPIISINLDGENCTFTLRYNMQIIKPLKSKTFKDSKVSTLINTHILANTKIKVQCRNKSLHHIANITKFMVGYSIDKNDMIRDILLDRYEKPVRKDGIRFENQSSFKPTQLQPEKEISYEYVVDSVGFDEYGKVVLHMIFVYENEYGILYDTYKKVEVGLNIDVINSHLKRMYENVDEQGKLQTNAIPDVESPVVFEQPHYTTYIYTPEERSVALSRLENWDNILSEYE